MTSSNELRSHRYVAAVRESKRLNILATTVGLSLDAILEELIDVHGWATEDAVLALADVLGEMRGGLLKALCKS